jgi:GT2 family glycosyltransferase/SAM-dependent methyltransferase
MPAALRSRARRALDRLRTSRVERARIEQILESGVFDAAHYLRHNPDVARSGRDPLRHYVRTGWHEGRSANPFFDAAYYRGGGREAAEGLDPLTHFVSEGWQAGRDPHPLFDTSFYVDQYPDVARSGKNPLGHFVTVGWREGRDPHPLFDTSFYLDRYADVARSGENPLGHFVTVGWREGRDPHPLFDTAFYLDRYPGVAHADLNPLLHYALGGGWQGRFNPHPYFDTAYYLDQNPDVAAEGADPLAHFVTAGMAEGRRPSPFFDPDLHLPLPEFAWAPGASRVERVLRTFAYGRPPLREGDIEAYVRAIEAQPAPPAGDAEASVIIPVFGRLELTLWCLHALLAGPHRRAFEIVVVDDGSADATPEVLPRLSRVRHVRRPENRGFVHACNLGAAHARGRLLVFLNNDTLPLPGWLDALADTLRDRPDAGLVGSKLIYPDGRLQEAGGIVWQNGAAWNVGRGGDRALPELEYRRPVDFCSGASIAVPADLFREAGGFDEAFAPAYAEDVDLALRLRARGKDVLYQPRSEVVHIEGASSGTSTRSGVKAHQVRNLERLRERWRIPLRAHRPEGQEPDLEKDRGAERRVLFMDLFTPRPDHDAGSLDALHWMRALTALGYKVTFAPVIDFRHAGRYTSDLQREGIECVYAPRHASAEAFIQARGAEFDLCVFYRFEAADALMRTVKGHAPQARRLLGLCDLAHVRLARKAEITGAEKDARAAREAKFRELLACAESDALFTPSRYEKDVLKAELPHADVFVCPLVQDLRPTTTTWSDRAGIGFVGGYRHAPNVDAVLFFVREVLPLVLAEEPSLRFLVAGSRMPPEISGLRDPGVEILGHVDDLQAFFARIRLSVAPIRFGSGVKGKVAASFAAGVPVVGTSVAVEGMELEAEEGALVADDPNDIAREILRLHRSEELWTRLSERGRRRAARDYSEAAGLRNVAAAAVQLGVGTLRARETAGVAARDGGLGIVGMEVDICRTETEYRALRDGADYRRRLALEGRMLQDAEQAGVVYRAYSVPARRPVVLRARVSMDAEGKPWSGWREELVCPITRLNNRQRAVAAFTERFVAAVDPEVNDVYATEQVTPLFEWLSRRFQTLHLTGSEYLGPDVPAGKTRDGIQHQDLERLGLATASQDLVVSCDVLEHVNEPQAALRELARVLRPGGHLLFTVPFSWHTRENRRRARLVDGAVEHLVPPSYHGNPMDPNGSLAFFDYGWELLDWVRDAGFRDVSVLCYWSADLGHLGGMLEAFHARR